MSNINQSLVEKVRNREAAILFDINKDSVEVLNELAKAISITSNGKLKGNHYYYGVHPEDNSLVFGFDNISDPTKYGAIPLSSFFEENLTPEDKESLNRIRELLAELKPLMYGVSHLIDQDCYNPYAPITPVCEQPDNEVEEKYVRINKQVDFYTEDKIYKVLEEKKEHYVLTSDNGKNYDVHMWWTTPSTREAYLSQEKAKIPLHNNDDIQPAQTTPVTVGTTKKNDKLPCPQHSTPKEVEQNERWHITVDGFRHNEHDHKITVALSGKDNKLSKEEALKISELIRDTLKQL